MHFHDTRGTALANVYAALQHGLQSSTRPTGGLGGCPYAPGATGNVGTEDVLYMLHAMGIETGVDLDKVRAASRFIAEVLDHAADEQSLSGDGSYGLSLKTVPHPALLVQPPLPPACVVP